LVFIAPQNMGVISAAACGYFYRYNFTDPPSIALYFNTSNNISIQ
jgi:hypothetical protein